MALGYAEVRSVDANKALKQAREMASAGTSMTALNFVALVHIERGNYSAADAEVEELAASANEKVASVWKAVAVLLQGLYWHQLETRRKLSKLSHGNYLFRRTGATVWLPMFLSYLAKAHADLHQLGDAQRLIGEAMSAVETTRERWCEAEVYRAAAEMS